MKRTRRVFLSALLLTPAAAQAQLQGDPGVLQPAPVTAASTQAAPLPSGADPASPERSQLEIEDPMLIPVPPPERQLKNWRQALAEVKARSPDYLRAQAQVEVALGQSRMALARSLPTLWVDGSVNRHLLYGERVFQGEVFRGPNPATPIRAGANLRIPILSARNWYDYSTSKKQVEQTKMTLEDAERLIIGGLAESIVTVVTAERLSEVTRVSLSAALSTLELNKRRARLGSGSALDVLRAKQEVTRSRAQVVEADETLREAREGLGLALGYSEAWGVTPDLKIDQLRQDARNTCKQGTDVKDRADVRAAMAGAAIAERNVNSVMYSHLPLVDLTSTFNHSNSSSPQPNSTLWITTWTIGAALTWHLYEGGLRTGEKRQNQGYLQQSQQTTIEIERKARLQVTQSARKVKVAKQSLEIALEARSIALDNARLAKTRFINGTGTSFDMVDTQTTARQNEIDVTVKEFQLLRTEIIAFLALASCEL